MGDAGEGPAAALEADAVIVGVRPGHVAEALTLARVLREQPSSRARGEQVVVALSSALTWALTPPPGDGRALTAADAGNRRATPGAQAALEAERVLLRAARPGLVRTYAVTSGVPYGLGEAPEGFGALFRGAWEFGRASYSGTGDNAVPTIHVRDLAEYVACVVVAPPARQGVLLAADGGRDTLRTIAAAVGSSLHGDAAPPPSEEALEAALLAEEGPDEPLDLAVNLGLTATMLDPMPTLRFPLGLAAHANEVREEFLEVHNLQPLKILVVAPPASGGSGIAASLSRQYSLPLIRREEALAELEEASGELKESVAAQLGEDGVGQVDAADLALLYRAAVARALRTNKGYVLDSFPDSLAAAEVVFSAGDGSGGAAEDSDDVGGEVAGGGQNIPANEGGEAPVECTGGDRSAADSAEPATAAGGQAKDVHRAPASNFYPGAVILCHCEPDALESRAESTEESMDVFRKRLEEYNEHRKFDVEDATERLRLAREERKQLAADEAERLRAEREASGAGDEGESAQEGGEAAGGEAEEDQESEEAAGNAADGGLCAFLKEGGAEVLEGDTTKTSVSDVSATMVAALGPAHNFVGLMPSSPRANPSKKSRGRGSEIPSVSEKQLLEGEPRAEAPSRGSEAPRSPGPGAGPPPEDEALLTRPLEGYLMGQVMPAVTEGLLELCKQRPEEPIAFMGRFLRERTAGAAAPAAGAPR